MSNKILLACLGGASEPGNLVAKVRILIGQGDGVYGFGEGSFGYCEVLEGEQVVLLVGFAPEMGFTLLGLNPPVERARIVNVTTGKDMTSVMTEGNVLYFVGDIFSGLQVGQLCVLEIYI